MSTNGTSETKNVRAALLRHGLTIAEFCRIHDHKPDTVKAVLRLHRHKGPQASRIRSDLQAYLMDQAANQ